MVVAFTGRRSIKGVYDLRADAWQKVKGELTSMVKNLIAEGYDTFITGGALGFDTLAFSVVHRLKEEYPNIKLHMYIPFNGHTKMWSSYDKLIFGKCINKADKVVVIDLMKQYRFLTSKTALYNKRNEEMVRDSNMVVGLWDGDKVGGTFHALSYAKKIGKPCKVIRI